MTMTLDDLDTPAVLIDIDRVNANLARAQAYADAHGLKLRPHIKTHKLPVLALKQVALGAVGITCQKLGEAEVMADAGITDILIPYNILGAAKLARLVALARRITVSVSADSAETVAGYAKAFKGEAKPLPVMVECDTGMGRCGVQTPAAALGLAERIAAEPSLRFAGIVTYPAAGGGDGNSAWLAEAVARLTARGLKPPVVSNGGTPDLWSAHTVKSVTEHRPGTYIYLDRFQVAKGVGTFDDCALTVLTTVVSRPTADRAILDAGSKALTSDMPALGGYGRIVEYPDAVVSWLSEEHANVDLAASQTQPAIGERVRVIPNHACVVSNLFDVVHFISGDTVVATVPVAARGKVG